MKKMTKYTIGVVVLAGVTTAVAAPVTIALNSPKSVYSDAAPKITDPLFGGVVGNFIKNNKEEEKTTSNFIKQSKNAQSYFIYKNEQKGSIELQKMDLKYDFYKLEKENEKLEKENKKLEKENADNPNKDKLIEENDKKIKANKEKIEENNENKEKIKKLIEGLNNPDTLDYDYSQFSKDYPKILMPIEKLEKDKKIQIDDEEIAFGKNYRDKGDWKKAWLEELRTKYNGATSNEEAAKNSIVPTINSIADKKWKIGINSSYIFEQTIAKYENKLIYTGNDKIFKIDPKTGKAKVKIDDEYKNIDVDTSTDEEKVKEKLAAKVYFIGSGTKIPNEIFQDITSNDEVIQNVAKGHFSTLQHMLWKVKQDENDPTAAWKVEKDLIKRLLKVKPNKIDGTKGNHLRIEELANLFKTSKNASENEKLKIDTKNFIANASDNGDKTKSGLLKTGKLADVLSGWNSGISLGLIDSEIKSSSSAQEGDNMISEIISKFVTFAAGRSDQAIQKAIDLMSDAKFKDVFGNYFKDVFSGSSGAHKLSYKTTNGMIIFSKEGIHITHLQKYSGDANTVAKQIAEDIDKDLQAYANDPTDNTIMLDFPSLFENFYTDASKFETLLKDNDFVKELKTGYEKTSENKTVFDLPDEKDPDTGKKYLWTDLIGKNGIFQKEIENAEKIDGLEKAYKIIGNGIQTYMLGGYDKGTLEFEAISSPQNIYDAALKIGRGENV